MTAYVTGTSTRKVDDLVRALGVSSGISKSTVSRICEQLDEEVAAFRDRALDHVEEAIWGPTTQHISAIAMDLWRQSRKVARCV